MANENSVIGSNTVRQFYRGTIAGNSPNDPTMMRDEPAYNVINDWLHPQIKERRQMQEQLEMDYYSPQAKMEGLIAAGVNPLTAAAGVAGAGSSAAPQPSTTTNPIGDIAGAAGAIAGGYQALAGGKATLDKLAPEISEIESSAKANLAKAGLDDANSQAVLTDNKYREDNWKAELAIKRQTYKNMQQELTNMKATHREILAHCDEMISQIELNGSQKDYYDSMNLKINEDLRWQKQLNDWRIANRLFITESGVDGYIFNMLYNEAPFGDVEAFFNAFYDYCEKRSYASNKGLYSADEDTAYNRAHNQSKGVYDSDPFQKQVRDAYDSLDRAYEQYEQVIDLRSQLDDKYKAGEISEDKYKELSKGLEQLRKNSQDTIDELEKALNKASYSFGHSSFKQDLLRSLMSVGIIFTPKGPGPSAIKGFGR